MSSSAQKNKSGISRKKEVVVTRVEVMCNMAGQQVPIQFMIGTPAQDKSPIQFQADYFAKSRNVSVPSDFMQFLKEMQAESERTGQNLASLIDDVVQTTVKQKAIESANQSNNSLSNSNTATTIDDFTSRERKGADEIKDLLH